MNNIDIDRINELYHKSKSVGLTKAEEAEQKKLLQSLPCCHPQKLAWFFEPN